MKQELSKNKYLFKRLKLEEIKNPQYFFEILAESNLVKFLVKIFFNKENFIKFFDFRIISSLILRDLNSSKISKSSIFNTFLLLILSIFLYRLSSKNIIEKKYLSLVKIVSGQINYYKYKEKKLKETFNKKNISTFTRQSLSENFDLKKKTQYSIIKPNLKKKIYFIPSYNKILIENSEWWKFWIIKEILPSWKISANSIKKVDNLLKKKNINDLKYFFKFYITNILCQNYDWEKKFDSFFVENLKKKNLKSIKNKKVFEDTLLLQIFSDFCEKLIFEVENPLKLNNFNSTIINLENNTNYNFKLFFSIPICYKKKNIKQFYLVKNNLIQTLKFWGESDPIIAKSYFLIKKKGWFFFNNYTEFYIWQFYKKNLFKDKNTLNKIKIDNNKLDIKLFKLKSLYKKKNLNRIETNFNFIKSNTFFLKWLLDKKKLNSKNIKQTITPINWNIVFLNKSKKNITKSNLFFFKNKQNLKLSYNIFSSFLSIDELNIASFITKKYKKKFRGIKKQENIFFRYFPKPDNFRLVFLWKLKKNYKNLNSFIFLDYAYKIIYKKKNNIKNLISLEECKSSKNVFYLLWFFIYKNISLTNNNKNLKYNKILFFQKNYFVDLAMLLNNLNLLLIKYNLYSTKIISSTLNYKNKKNYKLKKKLLITKINKKNTIFIKNNLEIKLKIHNIFSKFYTEIINNYKLIFNNFCENLINCSKNLFLINKLFYYRKNKILKNNKSYS